MAGTLFPAAPVIWLKCGRKPVKLLQFSWPRRGTKRKERLWRVFLSLDNEYMNIGYIHYIGRRQDRKKWHKIIVVNTYLLIFVNYEGLGIYRFEFGLFLFVARKN